MNSQTHHKFERYRKSISFLVIASLLSTLGGAFLAPNAAVMAAGYNGKIVFTSERDGDYEIYAMDANGGNQTRLTTDPAFDYYPAFSPDGSKIAYSSYDTNAEIYIMDADGSNKINLTNSAFGEQEPIWTPDGSKITYRSNELGGSNWEVFTMDPDGSNKTKISSMLGNEDFLTWSPDGTKLAFQIYTGGNYEIYVMDADGSNVINLSNNAGWEGTFPTWSPDGTKLLFTSQRDGDYEIYSVNADGTNLTRVTNTPGWEEYWYAWSPDGSQIITTNNNAAYTLGNLLVLTSTGDVVNTYPLSYEGEDIVPDSLSLSPDGKKVLIADYNFGKLYAVTIATGAIEQLVSDGETWAYKYYPGNWISTPNTTPVTTNDVLTTAYQTAGIADVLANDSDEEALPGGNLTIITAPLNGTAVVENGKVTYTPKNGFSGSDQLTYQICDAFVSDQKCAVGELSITVEEAGAPVVAISRIAGLDYDAATNTYTSTSARPTFSGTATPESEIDVKIGTEPIVLSTVADSPGNWSVAPTQDLPQGNHQVVITATLNGKTTQLDSFVLGISTTAEIPDTGASTWPMRVGGASLLLAGVGLAYWQRRRQSNIVAELPRLY